VKILKLTTIATLLLVWTQGSFAANSVQDAIIERLKPVGEVCVEGADCKTQTTTTAEKPVANTEASTQALDSSTSVADNYNKSCATCHAAGVAGAPKLGSGEDWSARIAKGKDVLYQSAIDGLPPAMPAKGMCFACSDDDLRALVDYMIESSQ
jgi:cytochrome c5